MTLRPSSSVVVLPGCTGSSRSLIVQHRTLAPLLAGTFAVMGCDGSAVLSVGEERPKLAFAPARSFASIALSSVEPSGGMDASQAAVSGETLETFHAGLVYPGSCMTCDDFHRYFCASNPGGRGHCYSPPSRTCVLTLCMIDDPPPPPPPPITGFVYPKYKVLSVIYAPPNAASSVTYGASSALGTTTTLSRAFTVNDKWSAEGALLGVHLSAFITDTSTSTHTNQLQVVDTELTSVAYNGPLIKNEIDHNYDIIVVLLNPQIKFTIKGETVKWTESINPKTSVGDRPDKVLLTVGFLNGTWGDPALSKYLTDRGLTSADLATILARDPLAGPSPTIPYPDGATGRYVNLHQTFPYSATAPGGSPLCHSYGISHASTHTVTDTASDSYSVGYSTGGGLSFGDWFKGTRKSETTLTWAYTNSFSRAVSDTITASATICQPPTGYTGPISIGVYYDLAYKTFMFSFPTPTAKVAAYGTVKQPDGNPAAYRPVRMLAAGVTYRTYTNADGRYQFLDVPAGVPAQLSVGAAAETVVLDGSPIQQDLPLY